MAYIVNKLNQEFFLKKEETGSVSDHMMDSGNQSYALTSTHAPWCPRPYTQNT